MYACDRDWRCCDCAPDVEVERIGCPIESVMCATRGGGAREAKCDFREGALLGSDIVDVYVKFASWIDGGVAANEVYRCGPVARKNRSVYLHGNTRKEQSQTELNRNPKSVRMEKRRE